MGTLTDMFAHLIASERFHTAIQIFGEVGEKITTFRRALPSPGLGPLGFHREGSGIFSVGRRAIEDLIHLFTHAQTCPM